MTIIRKSKVTREIAKQNAQAFVCVVTYEQRSYEHDFDEDVFDVKSDEQFTIRKAHFVKAAYMCNTLDLQKIAEYVAHKIIVGEDYNFFKNVKVTLK